MLKVTLDNKKDKNIQYSNNILELKEVNLFYGLNGSGKTTLSNDLKM
jgi:ATP-dependent phosphoenolpyruvate carboxykinase